MLTMRKDLASREKTFCDPRRDFAEKKSDLNDAFRALLLYKVIPFFRRSAQYVDSRAIETSNGLHMSIRLFHFPFVKKHESRITENDDDETVQNHFY